MESTLVAETTENMDFIVDESAIRQSTTARAPSHDEIAALAYALWLARNEEDGCPEDDWYHAEQILMVGARG